MDIYGIADSVVIILATMATLKAKHREGVLLLSFYAITSTLSAVFELSGIEEYWLGVFTLICVIYGSASYKHPIVIGYAACLFTIGIEASASFEYYSQTIFAIYLYQIWTVAHGHKNGAYSRYIRVSRFDPARHKIVADKEKV